MVAKNSIGALSCKRNRKQKEYDGEFTHYFYPTETNPAQLTYENQKTLQLN